MEREKCRRRREAHHPSQRVLGGCGSGKDGVSTIAKLPCLEVKVGDGDALEEEKKRKRRRRSLEGRKRGERIERWFCEKTFSLFTPPKSIAFWRNSFKRTHAMPM